MSKQSPERRSLLATAVPAPVLPPGKHRDQRRQPDQSGRAGKHPSRNQHGQIVQPMSAKGKPFARMPTESSNAREHFSLIAIVLSVAALGFQVRTWRQSGPIVEVTACQGLPVTPGAGAGDWHLNVTAINKGRSPVTVNNFGLKLPDKRQMAILQRAPWSASLPHRLEPGSSAAWYIDTEAIKQSCAAEGVRHQDLTAFVTLGDGRTIDAPRAGIGLK